MNQTLVDAIIKLTGKPEDEVQEKLASVPIDDLYKLMDLVRKGDKASIVDFIDPITESAYFKRTTNEGLRYAAKFNNQTAVDGLVDWLEAEKVDYNFRNSNIVVIDCPDREFAYRLSCKATSIKNTLDNPLQTVKDMADNKKITGTVPKPRDPMAKALALPQYQPKVTPSKKGQLDKALRKHKGRDMNEALAPSADAELVEEGVIGMTQMDSMLPRLLTLAGCPPVEDVPANDVAVVEPEWETTALDNLSAEWDELDAQIPQATVEPTIDATIEPAVSSTPLTNIQVIRDAFEHIRTNMPEIKVSEFAEVRTMMADLMSQIDRMGNNISGK